MSVSRQFGLKADAATAIIREVAAVVIQWRKRAAAVGLRNRDIDRMASAFEHDDLKLSRTL